MTSPPSTEPTAENKRRDNDAHRLLMALLFLLLSFVCIFCSSQVALRSINRDRIDGSVKARLSADYGQGPIIALAPLDRDRIIAEIIADDLALLSPAQTPLAGSVVIAILPQLTPEAIALLPTPTPTPSAIDIQVSPTFTPQPTAQSPPTPTDTPEPTSSPTTAPSPTSTPTPSLTPLSSPTSPTPTPTDILPTPTSTPIPPTSTPLPPTSTSEPPPTPTPTNSAPTAGDDPVSVPEDTPITINVLANDRDPDGTLDFNTLAVVSGPSNGTTAVDNTTGQITYTPNPNFSGTDTFVYQICDDDGACSTAQVIVTVDPANDPPQAVDDSLQADEDIPTTLDVLANDNDPDGDPLSISSVGTPANGSIQNNGDTLRYTSDPNFNGIEVFSYVVRDSSNLTDTATVTLTVLPVNDPPVAVDDTAFNAEDTSEDIFVLTNDSDVDGDPLNVIAVTTPANGTATINGNVVTYNPNPNFDGTDNLTYTISDGSLTASATITVTMIPINDPPVAVADAYTTGQGVTLTVPAATGVLSNDTDVDSSSLTALLENGPSSGTLTLYPDGGFEYIPNPGFSGIDTFTYRASDGFAQSAETTVTITIN